jgi:ssDNA-binding Zn-finger/Zn-ribbon topoisomerase 1
MSRKKKNHIILCYATCPKCGGEAETRQGTNGGKSFWFSQYDYCYPCKGVFFNEKYKVLNSGADAQRKFDARIVRKQNRQPERTKTEKEIADQKRAYAVHMTERDALMKRFGGG